MRYTARRRLRTKACYAAVVLFLSAIGAYGSEWGELVLKIVFVPCVLIILFWFFVTIQPRDPGARSPKRTSCPNCGYDLRATPDRCPECGQVETDYERFARDPRNKP